MTWLFAGVLLVQLGCSSSSGTSAGTATSAEEYQERRAAQKRFLRDTVEVEKAREALRSAIRQNPVVDGVPVAEDLVFSAWDLRLDCPHCSIQAGDWIVGLVSRGGDELTGISFSIGFDPKIRRVTRASSSDEIHFDFAFRRSNAGFELVFVEAGTAHYTLTP